MKSVCVFCGSGYGNRQSYRDAASELGRIFASEGIRLVYGGSKLGLMGIIADACLGAGGEVTGVIPRSMMEREIAHTGLSDLRIVGSMHERKALMADLAEAFIAMPGGFGTFDELFEILTWRQIRIHSKPVGLLDVDGYFDPLLAMADHAREEGFLRAEHRESIVVDRDPANLLVRLSDCK